MPVVKGMEGARRLHLFAQPRPEARPALFLDRDGVVIEDRHHLCDPNDVKLCIGAQVLIRTAAAMGWPVVIVTNQSGIARGYFSWHEYEAVTCRMLDLLGTEAAIAAIYACGDGPDAPAHSWRKPSPLMLLDAQCRLNLDLARSVIVGDRLGDLQAGAAAGLACFCHVASGYGVQERQAVLEWHRGLGAPEGTCTSLLVLRGLQDFPVSLLWQQ